jgi:hypothetical protein
MTGSTLTVIMPETIHDFVEDVSGTKLGTARFVECEIVERRRVMVGSEARLEYHKTGTEVRVFMLSKTASEIVPGVLGIAAMTPEGYWELVSVMC